MLDLLVCLAYGFFMTTLLFRFEIIFYKPYKVFCHDKALGFKIGTYKL